MTTASNINQSISALFILYVSNQEASTNFYSSVLQMDPTLYVTGMTEFTLNSNCKIGLMPENGIKKLLGTKLPNPTFPRVSPHAEIYLYVDDPETYHRRAITLGARELRAFSEMDWGDHAAYSLDLDGHVLVFASPPE